MNYSDVLREAKQNMGSLCKVCPICNGNACKGLIPGPGGKGLGLGFTRNYNDLRKIELEMDTLYQDETIDTSWELFGQNMAYPFFAAPIGGVNIHYGDVYNDLTYSQAIVEGCQQAGILGFTGDGVKDEVYLGAVEAIRSVGGIGIPTIKPWSIPEIIEKGLLAKNAGALAIAMDIDAAGLSILAAQGKPVSPLSVAQIQEIVKAVELPLIIKGIMTVSGAVKALEAGATGIIVSNHGGRVLDETPSGISVLEKIAKTVGDQMIIFVDGGFRSGLDVFKALALGADAVLIGRPYAISVYGGGAEGVQLYTEKIGAQLREAMRMTGASCLEDIDRSMVTVKSF